MRYDIDKLMEERGIDWLYISGGNDDNSAMHYFLGDAPIGHCSLWKPRGGKAFLLTGAFERDEASKLPFNAVDTSKYKLHELAKKYPDPLKRTVEYQRRVIDDLGISGRVALYGRVEIGPSYLLWRDLADAVKTITIEPELEGNVILTARETKEADEIEELKKAGRATSDTVAAVRALLGKATEREGLLWQGDQPLTVGFIKGFIALELYKRGMVDANTIFAPGNEGGYPHSTGTASRQLKIGEPIVFDIFPQQVGHGYYHDMTRTWCVGELHPEAAKSYELVKTVQSTVYSAIKVGEKAFTYHAMAAEMIGKAGHPDIISDPTTQTGFCHGLGHGVGLDVHERPRLGGTERNPDVMQIGSVFTNEPGVYYPDRGYGVRIEDTCYLDENGKVVILTDEPKDMLISLG